MAVFTSRSKIRFQDCDPFNHLNNARYIDYFLNARADQVLEHFDIDIFGGSGFTWLVGSNQIAYFKPAFLNEAVTIETQIIDYSENSLVVEMRMYDEPKTHLKSVLWVTSIPISLKTQRVSPHDERLMKLFEENVIVLNEKTFEDRRKQLYLQNKTKSA